MLALADSTSRSPSATLGGVTSDAEAFAILYREHYGKLVRALEIAGAEGAWAQDAAQEAFARALVHWRRIRTGDNPAGYVFRTAFRLLNKERAARRRMRAEAVAEGDAGALPGPESTVLARMTLGQALEVMPERQRQCVGLCLYLELGADQAADILGIEAATVRVHLHRARVKLRSVLG